MTSPTENRTYLDWNATAPLRPEARAAMLAAMDAVGNPSSVHAEGRAAKAIIEKARGQVASLVGCEPGEVVFTSGATEAAVTACNQAFMGEVVQSAIEHASVWEMRWIDLQLHLDSSGRICLGDRFLIEVVSELGHCDRIAVQSANSETGVVQQVAALASEARAGIKIAKRHSGGAGGVRILSDIVQSAGKQIIDFRSLGVDFAMISAHKMSGPKGVGALVTCVDDIDLHPLLSGGGQEQGRRSGTENVIGIAGFGAAAEAAQRDLEDCVWDRVTQLRDSLEERLEAAAPDVHIFGKNAPRLPNTSCFAIPGWKGETQVMQMDLAGYAISAGSACSSGKVGPSRVLLAMGFDEETAASAIRVSMGPTTTEAEVMGFAETWIEHYRRRKARAA